MDLIRIIRYKSMLSYKYFFFPSFQYLTLRLSYSTQIQACHRKKADPVTASNRSQNDIFVNRAITTRS